MAHCERDAQRPSANGHSPTTSPTMNGHANVVHINGYRDDPAVAAVLAHFADVRHEMDRAESRDDKAFIIQKFLDALPPALGQAARHHVLRQHSMGQSVNIDDLVNYLAKLEMASALATPRVSPSPPPTSAHKLSPLKMSPSKRAMPPLSAERESSDYIDFAPSRPHVHNLLSSDSRENVNEERRNGDARTQEMR